MNSVQGPFNSVQRMKNNMPAGLAAHQTQCSSTKYSTSFKGHRKSAGQPTQTSMLGVNPQSPVNSINFSIPNPKQYKFKFDIESLLAL